MGRKYARTRSGQFAFTGGRKRKGKGGAMQIYKADKGGARKGSRSDLNKITGASRRSGGLAISPIRGSDAGFVSSKAISGAKGGSKASRRGAKSLKKTGYSDGPGYIVTSI